MGIFSGISNQFDNSPGGGIADSLLGGGGSSGSSGGSLDSPISIGDGSGGTSNPIDSILPGMPSIGGSDGSGNGSGDSGSGSIPVGDSDPSQPDQNPDSPLDIPTGGGTGLVPIFDDGPVLGSDPGENIPEWRQPANPGSGNFEDNPVDIGPGEDPELGTGFPDELAEIPQNIADPFSVSQSIADLVMPVPGLVETAEDVQQGVEDVVGGQTGSGGSGSSGKIFGFKPSQLLLGAGAAVAGYIAFTEVKN